MFKIQHHWKTHNTGFRRDIWPLMVVLCQRLSGLSQDAKFSGVSCNRGRLLRPPHKLRESYHYQQAPRVENFWSNRSRHTGIPWSCSWIVLM